MSLNGYVTFLKFGSAEETEPYTRALKDNNIDFVVEDESYPGDPVIRSSSSIITDFRIKLKQVDFSKANDALENLFKEQLATVDKDYFMFDFNDDELLDVLKKRDEWGHFNFMLAQQLLKQKGKAIPTEQLEKFEEERVEVLMQKEKSSNAWIITAYILAFSGLFIFFTGIVAIFIGWQLYSFKKTLPNGQRVYVYTDSDRQNGLYILSIATICLLISTLFVLSVGFKLI